MSAVCRPLHQTIRQGSKGQVVVVWQKVVGTTADGIFGAKTHKATLEWQRAHDLDADGIVGHNTWASAGLDGPGQKVLRIPTPLSRQELVAALRSGHQVRFGAPASIHKLTLTTAHVALENAWGEAIYGYNFGNISAFGWCGDYNVIRVQEQVKPGKWQLVDMKFRVYSGPDNGAADYWDVMYTVFDRSFNMMDYGDPGGFALQLHNERYYTANPEVYSKSLVQVFATAGAVVAHTP